MITPPVSRLHHPAAPQDQCDGDQQHKPQPIITDQITGPHQEAGAERQFLFHMDELFHYFRHHCRQQDRNNTDGDQCQDNGVDHRLQQFIFHLLTLFSVIGQTIEHYFQMAGLFAGGHHCPVQLIENRGKGRHAICQRMPFQYFGPDCCDQRA